MLHSSREKDAWQDRGHDATPDSPNSTSHTPCSPLHAFDVFPIYGPRQMACLAPHSLRRGVCDVRKTVQHSCVEQCCPTRGPQCECESSRWELCPQCALLKNSETSLASKWHLREVMGTLKTSVTAATAPASASTAEAETDAKTN